MIDRTFYKWVSFETLLEEEEESFLIPKSCLFLVEIVDDNCFLHSTSASSVISQKSFRNFWVYVLTREQQLHFPPFSARQKYSVDSALIKKFQMEDPYADEKVRNKTLVEDVKPIVMAIIIVEVNAN